MILTCDTYIYICSTSVYMKAMQKQMNELVRMVTLPLWDLKVSFELPLLRQSRLFTAKPLNTSKIKRNQFRVITRISNIGWSTIDHPLCSFWHELEATIEWCINWKKVSASRKHIHRIRNQEPQFIKPDTDYRLDGSARNLGVCGICTSVSELSEDKREIQYNV